MAERKTGGSLRRVNMSPETFVMLSVMFYELFLHFATLKEFSFGRLICVLFVSLFIGMLLGLLCMFGKNYKRKRLIAMIVSIACAVLILVEYFVNVFFHNFMPFSDLLSNAGGVVGQSAFFENGVKTVLGGLWCIIICALPIIFYALFTVNVTPKHQAPAKLLRRRWLVLMAIVLVINIICVGFSADRDKIRKEYDYDTTVHSYGVGFSLGVSAFNSVFPPESNFEPTVNPVDPDDPNDEPPEKVYGDNVTDIDFDTLIANAGNSRLKSMHQYVASLTPSKQNEYTGLFKGKNLILITAEAFSAEVIDKDLTPTLYRLATKGIQFTDYYQPAWGGSTSTGEFSNITGIIPRNGINSVKKTAGYNWYWTMGNQLMRIGYNSYAYHNNSYTYYDRNKTHTYFGYSKFIGLGNGMEAGVKATWPESDKEMFDFTFEQYKNEQPFSIYYMTVSGHCNYTLTGNYMSKKNFEAVNHLPYSEEVKCYFAANMELEYGLASLVQKLEEAGIADDTVIVMGTDHYPYGLSDKSRAELYGYADDTDFKRDHSRLIIWSGCIEDKNIVVDTPTYSLDIVPTLSNLFGTEYDSRMMVGRDVFSDQMPLVIWNNYNWKTDKGTYISSKKKFIANDGVVVGDDYVENVRNIVSNKANFSKYILDNNYFASIYGKK